jgi:hypothetical protein
VSPEDEFLAGALATVKGSPLPEAADAYHIAAMRLLVGLCRELQRLAGDRPFILSCRGAGTALGIHHQTANKFLRRLTKDRIIIRTAKGCQLTGMASEFRYAGD